MRDGGGEGEAKPGAGEDGGVMAQMSASHRQAIELDLHGRFAS